MGRCDQPDDDSLPLSLERRIDAVCERFEDAWKAADARDGRPRIEEYLAGLTEPIHPVLVLELIRLEAHYRRRAGDEPQLVDYQARFPTISPMRINLALALGSDPPIDTAEWGTQTTSRPGESETAGSGMPVVEGYEILGELGRGAMGVVYRARQESLGRVVALKMIRAAELADARERDRFLREAEAVARLQHPNIVQVFEVGVQDGRPYFSQEYVDGGSLAQKLAGGPLPPEEAARLMETLARAVHHSHQRGIIHRDLKPSNVLLTAEGEPKVCDIGLAKRLDGEAGQTQTVAFLGTPCYMAPEQAEGNSKQVGPAADVWALGAILYECLTGRPPFRAATALETLEQVRGHEPVPPARLNPNVPRDLGTVCLKCLEKDPAGRYASAAALSDDLRRFLDGVPVLAAPLSEDEQVARWAARAGYDIVGRVGQGRVRLVYKARQVSLNRDVAFEVLRIPDGKPLAYPVDLGEVARKQMEQWQAADPDEPGEPERRLQRFRTEAEAVAALQHPHIVQVYDCGQLGERAYIAMEWLEGVPLADRLAGAPLAARAAAALTEQVARAVEHAHRKGFLHSDLKPSNVLFAADGTPRVDFELFRRFSGLPQVGGTPSYMAPEQVAGRGAGPVTDVYGLGATLYEMLTGRPPFRGATVGETLEQVSQNEPAPPARLNPKVPLDLETVCLKCLQKDPARRYNSAAALADELRCWLDGRPIAARPVGAVERAWQWARRNPPLASAMGAAAAALILGTIVSTTFGIQAGRNATAAREQAERADNAAAREKVRADGERKARRESQRLLGLMNVDQGLREADAGRLSLALLRMAQPLVVDPDNLHAAEMTRIRLTNYLRHSKPPLPVLAQLWHHAGPVTSAVFSPDGRRVVTASDDRSAQVWDAETGRAIGPRLLHGEAVLSAAFSPDGRRVVTACGKMLVGNGEARVWDASSGQPITPPLTHGSLVKFAAFSPDGRRVLSVSGTMFVRNGEAWPLRSGEARVWDAATGQPLTTPLSHGHVERSPANALGFTRMSAAFNPDGRRVVTASGREARVWDVETGRPVTPLLTHGNVPRPGLFGNVVLCAAFSPDGRRLVTASMTGAQLWDGATGQTLTPTLSHGDWVNSVAFSPDGRRVVTASSDRSARVWDAASGQPLTPPLPHGDAVVSAAFSPDGRRVVTASSDRSARVWDAANDPPLSPQLRHRGDVLSAAYSPDGHRVVTASSDGTAQVWDAATGRPFTKTLTHGGLRFLGFGPGIQVRSAAFSPDGRRVVTASLDWTAQVWDAATGKPLAKLTHGDGVNSAAYSPDGCCVVTASVDNSARVWDAETGRLLTPPLKHGATVRSAAFSSNGRRVLTASVDKTARVWDAETGRPVSPPLWHDGRLRSAAFSPDGRRVVTAGDDKTARVWDASADLRPTDDLVRLVHVLSVHRIDDAGSGVPLPGEETKRLWDELRAKYPADFTVSPAAARAWREREIGDCLRVGNLKAAEFHYWWLVAEMVQTAQGAGGGRGQPPR
jgi:WD40 repeat protein/serine/threonine protein kinase